MSATPRRYVTNTTTSKVIVSSKLPPALLWLLLPALLMLITPLANAALTAATMASPLEDEPASEFDDTNQLDEMLRTETAIIEALRHYIEMLEAKISIIKSKTLRIKAINDMALKNTQKYVSNPINALTIIKRFTADWKELRAFAANASNTEDIMQNIANTTESLKFPDSEDFDEAAGNLLRIQSIYHLEPQGLAVGEINGVKLGSEMSWSDCLEIGRKSDANGDYAIAKYWIEVALGKLPAASNATHSEMSTAKQQGNEKARFEILGALLHAEYNAGNVVAAMEIVNEMLQLRPTHKGTLKDKAAIETVMAKLSKKSEKKLQKNEKKVLQNAKSDEELLIEEICRVGTTTITTTSTSTASARCSLVRGNLHSLLLQPLQVEYINLDPYIVVYHNVLSVRQIENLHELLEERHAIESESHENVGDLQFTKMAHRKLARINQWFELVTGHASDLYDKWQAARRTHEDDSDFEMLVQTAKHKIVANAMFNLHESKLGGALVFPQLELSVKLPSGSLLYWSNLNEFQEQDYRSKQYVCPVIVGTELMAYTSIQYVGVK